MKESIRSALIPALDMAPELVDSPIPESENSEYLIKIHAAALNFADILKTKGQYQERVEPPFVPGLEGAGEILKSSDNNLRPGDRVAVCNPGTMAEIIAAPAQSCIKIPDKMSFEQAAGFQITYGTSHLALDHLAALQPGETLAVLGAAGGVGLTAVEIGKAMGARVIGIARGEKHLDAAKQAGASDVIDSETCADLKAALRDLGGVDVVYDPVGGEAGEAAFAALHRGGRFLVIGFASGRPPSLPLNHALVKNITIHGLYWGGYSSLNPQARQNSLSKLFAMFEAGKLDPVMGEILPLERINEGFELLKSRRSVGKIIITM